MKLLCVTDIHGNRQALERALELAGTVDAVLLGGDLTNFGTPNEAEQIVQLAQQPGAPVLAVAGNCDSEAIDQRLVELGVSLFGRGVQLQGIGFYGLSAMPPWLGGMYELTEEQLAEALAAGHCQLGDTQQQVLLSHPPPRDCQVDRTRSGAHVGSTALRQHIEAAWPALVVCGHIHEARGIDRIGSTTVVNCGAATKGYFALAEVDRQVRVELLAG